MKKIKLLFLPILLITFLFTGCSPTEKMLSAYNDDEIISQRADNFYEKKQTNKKRNNVWTYEVKQFTGVKKFKTITIEDNPNVDIDLSIISGDLKIVFINNDKEVIVITEQSCNETFLLNLPAGKYDVKIVGKYADFNLTFDFNFTYS